MSDDLSLGELGRIIQGMRADVRDDMQGLRADVRDDMAEIQRRLDRLVSLDVYTVEKAAMSKDIADLAKVVEQLSAKHDTDMKSVRDQRDKDAERVTPTRRWMDGTVLITAHGLVLPGGVVLGGGGN